MLAVLVERLTVTESAAAAEVSVRCARTWLRGCREEGELGLVDRSSAPQSLGHRISERLFQAIAALGRLRFAGAEIAEVLGMGRIDRVGDAHQNPGWARLGRVGPNRPQREERERRGELIRIDIEKLGADRARRRSLGAERGRKCRTAAR